ncbi:CHAT domain-containing protein [Mycena venus]|uniref:CHAT domain-containing protein n=1 Tax=Mycena venus TaxID=2733690 RepID=A0A8H6XLZ7_9AGAR|nr:CHAT domain-containing protein [Mycena venus]
MEDTAISSSVGISDYESMASDTQGIAALTSPSNETENGQSGVNPAKHMQQEQDEGESDEEDNQEEKDARSKPTKCLWQELDKDGKNKDNKDTVEEGKMMIGIEFTDMPGIETQSSDDKATEYFNMAHDLLKECKAACNISSLNRAIYCLECAAGSWPPGDTEFSDCLNHFATALLIRFIYTVDADDVEKAAMLRCGALGHPVQDFLQSMVQDRHEDVTSKDMMTSAVMILKEVLQAHDQAKLETAIFLYQEGLKQTPETHSHQWRILWELSDALLIQFHLTGNLAQVDNAISYLRQVQQAKPNRSSICLSAALMTGHTGPMGLLHLVEGANLELEVIQNDQKALDLMQLEQDFFELFHRHHDLNKLEAAVRTWREAEWLLSLGHESRGDLLNRLAVALQTRFEHQGDPKDIDEAITLHREALEIHAAPHPDRGISLDNLAHTIKTRFEQWGDPKDIDEAIRLHREALEIHAAPHPNRGSSLNNLAVAVQAQYRQWGDPKDIDEAISLLREALEIHAAPHPDRGSSLNHLAVAVQAQFRQWGDPKDIDEAISLLREALEIHAAPHPDRGISLNNLAVAVQTQFQQRGDPKDIDEAITLHREALEIRAAPHPDRGLSLNNLAATVTTRFEQQGDPKDIDEAITLHREALKIHAAPHPDRGRSLNNLATALGTRFEQQGDPKDIDETISLLREALEIHAAPHPDRGRSLNNLATAVQTRFEQQGDPKDIDEAITLHREALEIRAAPHPDRGRSLNNLANAVQTRFDQWGDPKDIDEAITLHREALEIRAAPHPNRGSSLNNLANAVHTRFEQRGDPKDIDEAITLHREALEIHAAPHPHLGSSLNNLAAAVQTRFEQRGDPKDIDEAITLYREALEIRAAPHPDRGRSLNNLAAAVKIRFEQRGDPKDIDEAITMHREALEIHAAPHPDRGRSLNSLAAAVKTRFEQQGDPKDIDEAITLHREASTYMYSSPLIRFSASYQWIRSATRHGHRSSVDAYRTAINLLPQLAAFSLDLKSRHQMLARAEIVSLASASAICAIGLNQNSIAVEFLEASRSIFWTQALNLRTPVDKLDNIKPELATKLRQLSQQLEQASFRDTSQNISMDTQHQLMSIEAVAVWCRKLNDEWDETVNAVRKVPGFKDFLLPKDIASLSKAAASGPIIILLASDLACSALIVKSSGGVQHVPLPALNVQTVKHYADLPRALSGRAFNVNNFLEAHGCEEPSTQQSDLKARLYGAQEGFVNMNPNDIFRRLLADIWQTIVKPVFEVLQLKASRQVLSILYLCELSCPFVQKSEDPSRLWWCLTGPFSFVPIHAAGMYDTDGTDCVSDYVISSYTPTLAALLDPPAHITTCFKMMAVIEPHAPKCSALPGTNMELEKIKSRVPSQWLTSLHSTTRDTVMHHLHRSSVVHFACHGTQDLENPLNSGLILSDGCLDMSQIMHTPVNSDTDMVRNSIKLAFLSACETAKGDAQTPDEAMHLAATLLFARFCGVVATMWRMDDDDGPKIADTFYEYLFKDCSPDSVSPSFPDLSKAAKALHLAVTKLYNEPSMTFQRWVPFVHYGL